MNHAAEHDSDRRFLSRDLGTILIALAESCRDAPLVIGFSGGPDSTYLALRARQAFERASVSVNQILLAHYNHAYDESDDEGYRQSKRISEELGLKLIAERHDSSGDRREESQQMNARRARYRFFSRVASKSGSHWIATAHTRSDQSETVLMNLARTGVLLSARGIPRMRPIDDENPETWVVRPMLHGPTRAETRETLRDANLVSWIDPSNINLSYQRNAIRHRVLPELARFGFKPDNLADVAEQVSEIEELLFDLAAEQVDELDDGVRLTFCDEQAAGLRNMLAVVLAYELLGKPARSGVGKTLHQAWSEGKIANYEVLTALPGGLCAHRDGERSLKLTLQHEGQLALTGDSDSPETLTLDKAELDFRRFRWCDWQLRGAVLPVTLSAHDGYTQSFDRSTIELPLTIRPWKPGDRLQPMGLGGTKKIQDIFTDAKVPRWQRQEIPIVSDARGIIWVPGHCIDERVKIDDATTHIVKLTCEPIGDEPDDDDDA